MIPPDVAQALSRASKAIDGYFAAESARLAELPAALAAAFDRYAIHSAHDREWRPVAPWYVVDGRTAERDVNWPGDLVSEHPTPDEARIGLMKAVLEEIGVLAR